MICFFLSVSLLTDHDFARTRVPDAAGSAFAAFVGGSDMTSIKTDWWFQNALDI